ncbi:hypothetical protein [Tessaracoccus sp.]
MQRRSLTKPGVGVLIFFSGPIRRSRLTQVTFAPEGFRKTYVVPECARAAILDAPTTEDALALVAAHADAGHVCNLAVAKDD